jgi:hypothetical protein
MSAPVTRPEFFDPPMETGELGRFGPYRILDILGKGGMGQVWLAEDTRLQRRVAVKVMNERIAQKAGEKQRFLVEARAMAAVHHDNVVTIFEVGEHDGTPFMAMEMLRGETLESLNTARRRLSEMEIIDIARQIATGLKAAHARGIIHRGIKPGNIWIEPESKRVKILDFGLATANSDVDSFSGRNSVVGSPGYLSPEQARNDPVDDRTDLYSVGVVLYQLCTGKLPFSSKSLTVQLIRILTQVALPVRELNPDVSVGLATIIDRLLCKEPVDRLRSATELETRLIEASRLASSGIQIVTITENPAKSSGSCSGIKRTAKVKRALSYESAPKKVTASWMFIVPASFLVLLLGLGIWRWMLADRVTRELTPSAHPTRPSTSKKDSAITTAMLKPLVLSNVIGDDRVTIGESVKYRVRLENRNLPSKTDLRRVLAGEKVAAQLIAIVKTPDGTIQPAPMFPLKLSPTQLPAPGASSDIDVQFSTAKMSTLPIEVIFELQTPSGGTVGFASTRTTIVERPPPDPPLKPD